jgi:gamma-glutamylcyclotransferase (GGCT)/AIG2-like uncharacterized protein YtfP
MRGESAHKLVAGHTTFIGAATVPGVLLSMGKFPGLVPGRGRVVGEVWRLDAPELLPTLDKYEGYNFERRFTVATLARGRRVRAMVYRYRGSRNHPIVPEGDWRKHRCR